MASQEQGSGTPQPPPPGYPSQAAIPQPAPGYPKPTPPSQPYHYNPTGGPAYVYTTFQPPPPQTVRVEIPASSVAYHQHVWSGPVPDLVAWLCCIFFFPFGILALCLCRHEVCVECRAVRPYRGCCGRFSSTQPYICAFAPTVLEEYQRQGTAPTSRQQEKLVGITMTTDAKDDEKAKHHKHKHGEDEKEKVEGDKHAGGAREEKLAPGGAPAAAPTPVRVQGVYVAPTPMAPLPGVVVIEAIPNHDHVWGPPVPDLIAWLFCILFFPFGIIALFLCTHRYCVICGAVDYGWW